MDKRRRAKASILAGGCLVLVATLALNWTLEVVLARRDPQAAQAALRLTRSLAAVPNRPVVAFIGTSRTELLDLNRLGVGDGPADPLCHNMARPFTAPVMQQIALRRLLAGVQKPAAVAFEIIPGVLSHSPPDSVLPPWWLSAREAGIQARYCEFPASWWWEWGTARAGAWYTYRKSIRIQFTGVFEVPAGPGRGADPPITPERRARGLAVARGQYETALADWNIHPLWDRAIRDLGRTCRDAAVPFAIYTMPESPVFRGWYGPGARERVRAYLTAVGREYNAPVFECTDWFDTEEALIDGHHLTPDHAAEFTRRFGRECVRPWLRNLNLTR